MASHSFLAIALLSCLKVRRGSPVSVINNGDKAEKMKLKVLISITKNHHGPEVQGANYKKILRLSYDVIITYDNRKLLSHRKIILRFFCN